MADRAKLLEVLRRASAGLDGVVEKKMFGCEALFTKGRVFALVWKTGRIAVKLPVVERYQALATQEGAAPWTAGSKVMGGWVLVPPKLEDPKALGPWLEEAHAMATAPPAKKAPARKVAAKNAAAKERATSEARAGTTTAKRQPAKRKAATPKVVLRK